MPPPTPTPSGGSNSHFTESVTFVAAGLKDVIADARTLKGELAGAGVAGRGLGAAIAGIAGAFAGGGLSRAIAAGMGGQASGVRTSVPAHVRARMGNFYRPNDAPYAQFAAADARFGRNPLAAAGPTTPGRAVPVTASMLAARNAAPVPLSTAYGLAERGAQDRADRLRRIGVAAGLAGVSADTLTPTRRGTAAPPPVYRGTFAQRARYFWRGDDLDRAGREATRQGQRQQAADEAAERRAGLRGMGMQHRLGLWAGNAWEAHGGKLGTGVMAAGATAAGLGIAGLQGSVEMNRFNMQLERVQRALGDTLLPVLERFTKYLGKAADWLNKLSPRQQDYVGYGVTAAAGYGALRAVGAQGVVHAPARWAFGQVFGTAAGSAAGSAIPAAAGAAAGATGGVAVPAAAGAAAGTVAGGRSLAARGRSLAARGLGWAGRTAAAGAGAVGWSGLAVGGPPLLAGAGILKTAWAADARTEEEERRNRGKLTDDEKSTFAQATAHYDQITNPEAKRRKIEEDLRKALRDQAEMEKGYSGFGRFFGGMFEEGNPLGSYGRVYREHANTVDALKSKRDGVLEEVEKHRRQTQAGGQFESGVMATYQRFESAFGKVAAAKQEELKEKAQMGAAADLQAAAKDIREAAKELKDQVGGGGGGGLQNNQWDPDAPADDQLRKIAERNAGLEKRPW